MDQIKIGKFIASERKAKNLTQKQLAEQLNISDKTVSKWETGKGLPEVTFMLPLCKILGITVNELLSGERVYEQDYQKKAEENMMNLVREQEESRKKIILSFIVAFTGVILGTLLIFCAAEMIEMTKIMKGFIIVVAGLGYMICIGVAIVLDREAGAFECAKCHERFVPGIKEYIMGPHTFTKRKLKCPHCGKVSYCKHVLSR